MKYKLKGTEPNGYDINVLRAFQWDGTIEQSMPSWLFKYDIKQEPFINVYIQKGLLRVQGKSYHMLYAPNEWIIMKRDGELFRCRPENFSLYYEPITRWQIFKTKFFLFCGI